MTILEKLTSDLTVSMKARDAFRTNTIRQMIAALRTAEKAGKTAHELSDAEAETVLTGEVKKRRESAQIYTEAGADERAATETAEAELIESYLPAALTDAEVDELVAEAIVSTGATTPKEMGQVMKAANAAAAGRGRVDGKVLSQKVRAALQG